MAVAQEPAGSGIVTIEGTRIVGDQEVPTVMYLVPWQPPEVEALPASEELRLVSDDNRPLDRYEFRRLVRYQSLLQQNASADPSEN